MRAPPAGGAADEHEHPIALAKPRCQPGSAVAMAAELVSRTIAALNKPKGASSGVRPRSAASAHNVQLLVVKAAVSNHTEASDHWVQREKFDRKVEGLRRLEARHLRKSTRAKAH